MTDLFSEGLVSLSEASRWPEWPHRRHGKSVHISTLIRWAQHGISGVRLETIRCGQTLCTTRPAAQRFLYRLTESTGVGPAPEPPRAIGEIQADAILDSEKV
jgi:hypothetical protein